jgi:hypothetical protein
MTKKILQNQNEDNTGYKINCDQIDLNKIDFIFKQAEKCLVASQINTDSLDKKAFIIIVGSLSFISALIILMLTKEFEFSSLILLMGFIIGSGFAMHSLVANSVHLIGNKPMEMLKPKYSSYSLEYLMICEVLSIEIKIDSTIKVNLTKAKSIKYSINIILLTLVIVGLLMIFKYL